MTSPSVRKIIARSKSIVDLTLDDDDDCAGDKNIIETASNLQAYSPHISPSSLQKSPAHTADDHTTSSVATTPARKISPWKNVPPWSPLYHKLQLHSTTSLHNPAADTLHAGSDSRGSTEPESSPNKVRVLAVELSKKTDPTDSIVNANANDSEEAPLETTESSEQPLAAVTTLVSTMVVDISKLTTVKILDKRSNASRVEYECELKPLWLAADLVEKARMGRVCIRGYENGLVRAERLLRLRAGKRKLSQM